MPYKSRRQQRLMQAVAHNAAFAQKVGIPQSVGQKFEAHKAKGGKIEALKELLKKQGITEFFNESGEWYKDHFGNWVPLDEIAHKMQKAYGSGSALFLGPNRIAAGPAERPRAYRIGMDNLDEAVNNRSLHGVPEDLASPEELAALRDYQSSGYMNINNYLRTGEVHYGPQGDLDQKIKDLDALVSRSSLLTPMRLFRGIKNVDLDKVLGRPDPGFQSWSVTPRIAESFGSQDYGPPRKFVFHMEAPAGIRALSLNNPHMELGEGEVLLPREHILDPVGTPTVDPISGITYQPVELRNKWAEGGKVDALHNAIQYLKATFRGKTREIPMLHSPATEEEVQRFISMLNDYVPGATTVRTWHLPEKDIAWPSRLGMHDEVGAMLGLNKSGLSAQGGAMTLDDLKRSVAKRKGRFLLDDSSLGEDEGGFAGGGKVRGVKRISDWLNLIKEDIEDWRRMSRGENPLIEEGPRVNREHMYPIENSAAYNDLLKDWNPRVPRSDFELMEQSMFPHENVTGEVPSWLREADDPARYNDEMDRLINKYGMRLPEGTRLWRGLDTGHLDDAYLKDFIPDREGNVLPAKWPQSTSLDSKIAFGYADRAREPFLITGTTGKDVLALPRVFLSQDEFMLPSSAKFKAKEGRFEDADINTHIVTPGYAEGGKAGGLLALREKLAKAVAEAELKGPGVEGTGKELSVPPPQAITDLVNQAPPKAPQQSRRDFLSGLTSSALPVNPKVGVNTLVTNLVKQVLKSEVRHPLEGRLVDLEKRFQPGQLDALHALVMDSRLPLPMRLRALARTHTIVGDDNPANEAALKRYLDVFKNDYAEGGKVNYLPEISAGAASAAYTPWRIGSPENTQQFAQGVLGQLYGLNEQGEPEFLGGHSFSHWPGIVDETLSLPTILPDRFVPEFSKRAAARVEELNDKIYRDMSMKPARDLVGNLYNAAGTMAAQIPTGGAKAVEGAVAKPGLLRSIGRKAAMLGEWFTPTVEAKLSNYLSGIGLGGALNTLGAPQTTLQDLVTDSGPGVREQYCEGGLAAMRVKYASGGGVDEAVSAIQSAVEAIKAGDHGAARSALEPYSDNSEIAEVLKSLRSEVSQGT